MDETISKDSSSSADTANFGNTNRLLKEQIVGFRDLNDNPSNDYAFCLPKLKITMLQ